MRTAQGAQARSRSSAIISESIAELMRRATPMAFTQYAANMARAFMAVELAMASVNCGAPIATRAQAEKLLDEYFALVEQAVARPSAKRFAQSEHSSDKTRQRSCPHRRYSSTGRMDALGGRHRFKARKTLGKTPTGVM